MSDDREKGPTPPREPRLRDIARRIFREDGAPEGPEHEHHERMRPREMLGAMLETGDKAKTEMVKMLAREFRNYLDELRVGEDLKHLITNYSFEVKASFNLRPLSEDQKQPEEEKEAAAEEEAAPRPKRKGRKSEPPPDEASGQSGAAE